MFETRQISYIVNGYNDIFGRFTLENRAGEEVTMFVEDFDGFVIGGVEVSEAVMTAWLAENHGNLETIEVTEDNVLIVEGEVVTSNEEFVDAINEAVPGDTILLGAGTYTVPSGTKDLIIMGSVGTVIDLTGTNSGLNNVTFIGVTFDCGNSIYHGYIHSDNLIFIDCTFNGLFFSYAANIVFDNCTFNNLDDFCIWTYSSKNIEFTDCVFNTAGKAILIYNEDSNHDVNTISVTGCTFNATTGAKSSKIANQNCAAIEIDNLGDGVNLTTSNNKISDNFSGEWRIKVYYENGGKITINNVVYTTIALDGKTMTIDENGNVTVNE
jgi:hypothetical protein